MTRLLRALLALVATCDAALLPTVASLRPMTRGMLVRMQFAQPPDLSDENVFPNGPDGQTLVTYASLGTCARVTSLLSRACGFVRAHVTLC